MVKLSDLITNNGQLIPISWDYYLVNSYTNLYNIYDIDLSKYDLKLTKYDGSFYAGTKDNPYLILYDANPNANNDVILHEKTGCMTNFAFLEEHRMWAKTKHRFREIVLNDDFNSFLDSLCGVYADGVVCHSNKLIIFEKKDIKRLVENLSYIYLPNIQLSDIGYKEVKIFMVNGFFEKEYTGVETKKDNKYLAYLEKSIPYFYPYFNRMPKVLDYLLTKVLIKYEEIEDIINLHAKNKEIVDKLLKYRDDNFSMEYEIEKENPITYQDVEDQLDFEDSRVNVTTQKPDCQSANPPFYAETLQEAGNITKYKKAILALDKVNKKDIFMCQFKGDVCFFEVTNKLYYRGVYKVQGTIMETSDFFKRHSTESFRQKNKDKIETLSSKNQNYIYHLMCKKNCVLNITDGYLTPQIGLFDKYIKDGKLYEISKLDYSNYLFDDESYDLLEPYFCFKDRDDKSSDYAIFRRVTDYKDIFTYMDRIGTNLIYNCKYFDRTTFSPFKIIKDINKVYVNSKNIEYPLYDVFAFISNMLFRGCTLSDVSVVSYFSEYYQRGNEIQYLGFSSDEIRELLFKNFQFREYCNTFQFIGYDTYWQKDDDMYLICEEWFRLFYETVKKHPTIDYRKCADIKPRKNATFFTYYEIPEKLMPAFIKAVDISTSFDRFFNLVKDLFNNRSETLLNRQHIEVKEV